MAAEFVWRHRDRREVEIALYVALRMMHVPGVGRMVVCCTPDRYVFLGLELAASASEEDAQTWAHVLDKRYRVEETIDGLLADVGRFWAVYIDGGVGEFLNGYEAEQRRGEELRRRARREKG